MTLAEAIVGGLSVEKKKTFPVKKAGAAYFSAAIDLLSPSCHFYCLVVSSIFVNMELNLDSKIPLLPFNVILRDLHPTNVSFIVFSLGIFPASV